MLTLIFGVWVSEPPRAWWTTEKAGPDRVKSLAVQRLKNIELQGAMYPLLQLNQVFSAQDYVNIMDHLATESWWKGLKVRKYKSRFMQSVIN